MKMPISNEIYSFVVSHPISILCAAAVLYPLAVVIYRLYLDPLSAIPGPKLAAITFWYEYYYDGIKKGQYTFQIEKLHKQYGPIIRINPHELHILDSNFIDQIYAGGGSGKKRDKSPFLCNAFGTDTSFSTIGHDHHRLRRNALNRFFSKASAVRREPFVHRSSQKLCDKLETYAKTQEPVQLEDAFSCFTTDVITEYAYGIDYKFIDSPGFENTILNSMNGSRKMFPLLKQFPWMIPLMNSLPENYVMSMMPAMHAFLACKRDIRNKVEAIRQALGEKAESQSLDDAAEMTVIEELLKGNLPKPEKNTYRIGEEAMALIGAGTETTSWTLSVALFYLLSQPDTLQKLQKELERAGGYPDSIPSYSSLEQVSYLSAVIAEALRVGYGVVSRLARAPHEPLVYSSMDRYGKPVEYIIPPGTPVGMSSYFVHRDPKIFPSPEEFRPERWLDSSGARHHKLDGYLLSFSKGSRACAGMNLAYVELYVCLSTVVLRLGKRLRLFETDIDDVKIAGDYFMPVTKETSKGIRVVVGE